MIDYYIFEMPTIFSNIEQYINVLTTLRLQCNVVNTTMWSISTQTFFLNICLKVSLLLWANGKLYFFFG
jgi:hypothetical protein